MKLNKLQRYTAYCIMLEEAWSIRGYYLDNGNNPFMDGLTGRCGGFCDLAMSLFEMADNIHPFVEIMKHRPEPYYAYWFPSNVDGWDKRISILNQAIKETHPDL